MIFAIFLARPSSSSILSDFHSLMALHSFASLPILYVTIDVVAVDLTTLSIVIGTSGPIRGLITIVRVELTRGTIIDDCPKFPSHTPDDLFTWTRRPGRGRG